MPVGAIKGLGSLVDIGTSELTQGPRRHYKTHITSLLQPLREYNSYTRSVSSG